MQEVKQKPITRDIKLTITNERIRRPGARSFQYPDKNNELTRLSDRGHEGSKHHPRG